MSEELKNENVENENQPADAEDPKKMTGPIAWMARNHVTSNLLMIFFIIGGLLAAASVTQEVFPEFTLDTVSVRVSYPGASPAEVEQGIVLAIEEAVRGVENVVEVVATANEGSASIRVEHEPDADPMKVYQDIQQEVDRIRTFPDDAEEPEISIASRRRDVMDIQVYGEVSEWALRNVAEEVRDRLLQPPGVTQVELDGARDYEVHIMPSREALRRYDLTLQDISNIIARNSVEIPGGGIRTAGGEVLVRFDERRDYSQEFASIPVITTEEGAVVRLDDIAEVRESFEDVDRYRLYDGMPAIGLEVFRVGKQRPIDISVAVNEALAEIEKTLPEGVFIAVNDDDSDIFEQRRNLLLKNLGMGLVLVLTFLGLFLEPRLAFWVMLGIPISFLGSFLFLAYVGVSLNVVSMFAFIIGIGIVVDDAIVVGENVHEYRSQGYGPLLAAIKGAQDVAVPVTYSILTNCIAFLPLLFIPGWIGKIWGVIPFVVISVFVISLIESLFVLPAHLAHLDHETKNPLLLAIKSVQQKVSNGLLWFINTIYAPFLKVAIHGRYMVVAIAIMTLTVLTAYALSGRMGMSLMPKVESDRAVVTVSLPVGSPLETAHEIRKALESTARDVIAENGGDQLALGMFTRLDSDRVRTDVYLRPAGERPISTGEFTRIWRDKVGQMPSVESIRFESDRGGPGGGASVGVELSHSSVETLEEAAEELGRMLAQYDGVSDIDDGFAEGKEQLDFALKPEGRSLGLTSSDVARQIRAAFEGQEAVRQQRERNEVKVRVFLPEEQRRSEFDIEQLMIRTPSGEDVPLRLIADVKRGRAYTSIERTDGRRTLEVTANVTPDDMSNQVQAAISAEIMPKLMLDYPGLSWRFGGRGADMNESMQALFALFAMALLGIYTLLAIPFKSYLQPCIVMFAIPFGIVGAIIGHLVMGYSLSVISMMGIIALSGVVINDAIVMIVFANKTRDAGATSFSAIHQAGVRRFRPILLTTLTTFGGLAPMIFETSRQARFMIPMAISLGYGLVFATAIILILIPSLYMIVEDFRSLLRTIWRFLSGDFHLSETKSPSASQAS
jgi:multidrug efflux pump subunit AcrB